ncbi:MAG: hypothetical protein B0A82_23905 [Alkalinema sp. CACIAM 70d]|nr:MAG: hypothetical protein B0A82_23905 [Alkalinema sp. CACIAM 70d]
MKIVELHNEQFTLDEIITLAKGEAIVLRNSDGNLFALASIDDFDVEIELLKKNPDFMALLKELSQEKATISLKSLRGELGS